ncbi:MAG: hypothetical protein M0Z78_08870 [Betaproteobacteria bacterium]|nr:hypothetical protein [Betaproteobacteria bacterium]
MTTEAAVKTVKPQKAEPSKRAGGTAKRPGSPVFSNFADRNKRELTPNLAETHKLLTAVQFGDRAALLVRKRMSLTDSGPLPATKALGLLEQYDTAINNYVSAVDALCRSVGIDRVKQSKPTTGKGKNKKTSSH